MPLSPSSDPLFQRLRKQRWGMALACACLGLALITSGVMVFRKPPQEPMVVTPCPKAPPSGEMQAKLEKPQDELHAQKIAENLGDELLAISTPEQLRAFCARLRRDKRLGDLLPNRDATVIPEAVFREVVNRWLKQGDEHFLEMVEALPAESTHKLRYYAVFLSKSSLSERPELLFRAADLLPKNAQLQIVSEVMNGMADDSSMTERAWQLMNGFGKGSIRNEAIKSYFGMLTQSAPADSLNQILVRLQPEERDVAYDGWFSAMPLTSCYADPLFEYRKPDSQAEMPGDEALKGLLEYLHKQGKDEKAAEYQKLLSRP